MNNDDDKTKLQKAYQEGLKSVPPEIMGVLGKDASSVQVEQGNPKDAPPNTIAEYRDGKFIVYDPGKYEGDPGQTTGHELTHDAQGHLAKSVQKKFPEVDQQNRYGQVYKAPPEYFQQQRNSGKTMANFSEEEQAAMVQRFIFESQNINSKVLSPQMKIQYQKDIEAIKPFIHDYVSMSQVKDEPSVIDKIGGFIGSILPK